MRQFMFGLACGVGVAAIGIYSVSPAPRPPADEVKAESVARATRTETTQVIAARVPEESTRGASPAKPLAGTQSIPPASASAPARTEGQARPAEIPRPPQLSAEHAELLKPEPAEFQLMTASQAHMLLSTEPKDTTWSWEMERLIGAYLAANNASGEFEFPSIECRKTLCEILAFGNLPTSPQRWSEVSSGLSRQAWWSNFAGMSMTMSGKNGRYAFVAVLQRSKQ